MNRELLKNIYTMRKKADEWFEKIPREISIAFLDNPAMETEYKVAELLLKELYKEHAPEVSWLFYEWKPSSIMEFEGNRYKLDTLDEAIDSIFDISKLTPFTEDKT
jgi:hypothetical protein